jgi:hypothetical protein
VDECLTDAGARRLFNQNRAAGPKRRGIAACPKATNCSEISKSFKLNAINNSELPQKKSNDDNCNRSWSNKRSPKKFTKEIRYHY